MGQPPHFAAAYYVEEDHRLLLTSLTDRGFQALGSPFQQTRIRALDRTRYPL